MTKELSEETLNVCVCAIHEGPIPYIAHCLRLELIGEGQTRQQAMSRLEGLMKLQCRIHQGKAVSLWGAAGSSLNRQLFAARIDIWRQ